MLFKEAYHARSSKPVSDRVINLYLYTNIRTDSGRRPEIFGCSLCKTHLCSELCFAQFHAKILNIYRKNKRLILRWMHCLFDNLSDFANLFHCVIIIRVHTGYGILKRKFHIWKNYGIWAKRPYLWKNYGIFVLVEKGVLSVRWDFKM